MLSGFKLIHLPCVIERQRQLRCLVRYSEDNIIFPDLTVCQGKCCRSKNEQNTMRTEKKIMKF